MQKISKQMKLLTLVVALFGVLLILPLTSAAVAWVTPAANANLSTSVAVNVSFVNVTDITDPVSANTTFYWNGSGSWVAVSKNGLTCTATHCNATLTLTGLTDLANGYLNVTLGNNTQILSGTTRVVTVDNTDPTGTLTLLKPSIGTNDVQEVTWTSSDATSGVQTVSLTVTSPNTDSCATQSSSSTSGTMQLVGSAQTGCTGTYTTALTITDYASNEYSTSQTFDISAPGLKNGVNTMAPAETKKGNSSVIWIILIVIAVIYFANKKK